MTGFGFAPEAYPSGAITWFHGTTSDVPSGWAVCDGNNGTPNLLGRYLRSVPNSSTDPGATGGTNSQTLSASQLPSHTHSSVSTTTNGSHYHTDQYSPGLLGESGFESSLYKNEYDSFDIQTSYSGSHSHSVTVDNVGSGNSINNEPSHVKLIPIQKL